MNISNNTDIFSGLEDLGFEDVSNIKLFNNDEEEITEEEIIQSEEEKQKGLLYDREVVCPVCGNKFHVKSVKTSAARVVKKDSDLFVRYCIIDPYFYDVWLCNACGYAAMKKDFEKIRGYQQEKIQQNIATKWRGRKYPDIYDVDIAIERYRLSLLNYCVAESRSSSKAMNCLKLAWMFRLKGDVNNEITFIKQAIEGFNDAFYNEDFPLYGMDKYTTMYLLGELNRRVNNFTEAMVWFSKVITTPSVHQKLKEKARDQKDLIHADQKTTKTDTKLETVEEKTVTKETQNIFTKILKKLK